MLAYIITLIRATLGAVYEIQGASEASLAAFIGGEYHTTGKGGRGRSMALFGDGDKCFSVSQPFVPISGLDPPGRGEQGVTKAGDLLPGKTGMAKFGMVHPSIRGQSAKLFR